MKLCCQTRSHFGTVMANDEEVKKFNFFLSFRACRDIRRPSSEWGPSPVEEQFIKIQFVVVLANTLKQFGMYNVYKDEKFGLDLVQDEGPNNGVFLHNILPKHSLILRAIYLFVNEMKFWVVSNPLPQVN